MKLFEYKQLTDAMFDMLIIANSSTHPVNYFKSHQVPNLTEGTVVFDLVMCGGSGASRFGFAKISDGYVSMNSYFEAAAVSDSIIALSRQYFRSHPEVFRQLYVTESMKQTALS